MKRHTFISYTIRDGFITNDLLLKVKKYFNNYGTTFVDLLDNNSVLRQERVYQELNNANLFVLLKTPAVNDSPWVAKELKTAQKRMLPIVRLTLNDIKEIQKRNYCNENYF